MKKILAFIFLFNSLYGMAQNTFVVSKNPANNSSDAVWFETFKEAHDAASPNDIILMMGAGAAYGTDDTIKKPLIIYGPGYHLGDNPNPPATSTAPAKLGKVVIHSDGAGTFISGVQIEGILYIQADDCIVQRNRIRAVSIQNVNTLILGQNYVYSYNIYNAVGAIDINNSDNILIQNNYLYGGNNMPSIRGYSSISAIIQYNIIIYRLSVFNSVVSNNVILGGAVSTSSTSNNNYTNNVFLDDFDESTVGGTGNVSNAGALADVFVNTGSDDGKWQLKDGFTPTDVGMFAGQDPYILSGISGIPYIYELHLPTNVAGDNLNGTVKVRTNN